MPPKPKFPQQSNKLSSWAKSLSPVNKVPNNSSFPQVLQGTAMAGPQIVEDDILDPVSQGPLIVLSPEKDAIDSPETATVPLSPIYAAEEDEDDDPVVALNTRKRKAPPLESNVKSKRQTRVSTKKPAKTPAKKQKPLSGVLNDQKPAAMGEPTVWAEVSFTNL